MRIGVLTSSRADYGIYFPLLSKLEQDDFFELELIVFGMHTSELHGSSLDAIKKDKFKIAHIITGFTKGDSPQHIVEAMGQTILKFASVWTQSRYDLVFALGDRFEMFAAVSSTVPFNINVAHIHGGETTLGAIDDCFRHSISLMSHYHFPVTEQYRKRIIELTGDEKNIFNVGSLSYDNLINLSLYSIIDFKEKFGIDLSIPTILITFNPETISFQKNERYVSELIAALAQTTGYQFVITMPNADTMGNLVREKLSDFGKGNAAVKLVESLGTIGYLSCMKHCSFMLGNTSSGFAEAAFFPKYVINLGDRQKGRMLTPNIRNCKIEAGEIAKAIAEFDTVKLPSSIDVYGTGNSASRIIKTLKEIYG